MDYPWQEKPSQTWASSTTDRFFTLAEHIESLQEENSRLRKKVDSLYVQLFELLRHIIERIEREDEKK